MSSESESGSESENELSEWNGFSDTDEPEADALGGDHTEDSVFVAAALPTPNKETNIILERSAIEVSSEDEDDTVDTQTRARDFKEWAREQSGFGSSVSNISSLPQFPPDLKKPKVISIDKPDLAKAEKPQPVYTPQFQINYSPSLFLSKGNQRYKSQDFHCQSSQKSSK